MSHPQGQTTGIFKLIMAKANRLNVNSSILAHILTVNEHRVDIKVRVTKPTGREEGPNFLY